MDDNEQIKIDMFVDRLIENKEYEFFRRCYALAKDKLSDIISYDIKKEIMEQMEKEVKNEP